MTREAMAQQIVDWEARRDRKARLVVYRMPANDGGGSYEVAGINDRYHPEQARYLAGLIAAGRHDEAEAAAREYIARYTAAASGWTSLPAAELFLRDCIFNRGPSGAKKILQLALGVKADGCIGPATLGALGHAEQRPLVLLARLRAARERYEDMVAPGRANLRVGLMARWDNCFAAAADEHIARENQKKAVA